MATDQEKCVRERGVARVASTPNLVTAVRSVKQFLTYVDSGPDHCVPLPVPYLCTGAP